MQLERWKDEWVNGSLEKNIKNTNLSFSIIIIPLPHAGVIWKQTSLFIVW